MCSTYDSHHNATSTRTHLPEIKIARTYAERIRKIVTHAQLRILGREVMPDFHPGFHYIWRAYIRARITITPTAPRALPANLLTICSSRAA